MKIQHKTRCVNGSLTFNHQESHFTWDDDSSGHPHPPLPGSALSHPCLEHAGILCPGCSEKQICWSSWKSVFLVLWWQRLLKLQRTEELAGESTRQRKSLIPGLELKLCIGFCNRNPEMITHLERTEEIGEIDGATERAGQRQLCPFPFREKKRMREKNVITVHSGSAGTAFTWSRCTRQLLMRVWLDCFGMTGGGRWSVMVTKHSPGQEVSSVYERWIRK